MNARWKARLSIPFPILKGENKGKLWSLGTGKNYFLDRFEPEKARAIAAAIRPGEVAWDIGAHRGYMTLVMAQGVGPSGSVESFEPDPLNQVLLDRHVRWNQLANVTVHPFALADAEGNLWFKRGHSSLAGKLDLEGDLLVPVKNPATLIRTKQCPPPTFIKIDAEGAELEILNGFGILLRDPEICLVVSTDSEELHVACTELLQAQDLQVIDSGKRSDAEPWKAFGDVELFAFGRGRRTNSKTVELVQMIGRR